MTRYTRSIGALAALFMLAAPDFSMAQPPAYQPGLGDLMTAFVQPRHAKLGLAGGEQNWVYAAHALHELEEVLERISKAMPKFENFSIPEMMDSTVKPPLAAIDRAIEAGDSAGFATAFGQLTAACNACHQSTEHGFIVIQAPAATSFPNQDFRPAKK